MPWINIVDYYNDQVRNPEGVSLIGRAGVAIESQMRVSESVPNQDTIIWQQCSIEAETLSGTRRSNVGPYSQDFSGPSSIGTASSSGTNYSPALAFAPSRGSIGLDVWRKFRYRLAPLIYQCGNSWTDMYVGVVMEHTSYSEMEVIGDKNGNDPNKFWEWTEIDFTGRENEVSAYHIPVGVGFLAKHRDWWDQPNEAGWVTEWEVWVDEEDVPPSPPVKRTLFCPPRLPKPPCPVRPVGFIPFSEYDPDFKYPLKSSRIPSPIKINFDCIACGPEAASPPIDPPIDLPIDPPGEVCLSAGSTGWQLFMYSDLPSWWQQAIDSGSLKITGSNWHKTFEWYGGEFVLYSSGGGEPPYDEEVKAVISFEGMSRPAQCIYYTNIRALA